MMMTRSATFRTVALISCFLALAACSKKNKPDLDAGFGDGSSIAAPGSKQEFQTVIGDRIYFIVDQVDLTPEGREILGRQAQWLLKYPQVTVQVEGHADERGTREYNIALGARRAQSVKAYMQSRGLDANRMRTISYGKERPVAVCNDISCWSQNRRAVTVLNAGS